MSVNQNSDQNWRLIFKYRIPLGIIAAASTIFIGAAMHLIQKKIDESTRISAADIAEKISAPIDALEELVGILDQGDSIEAQTARRSYVSAMSAWKHNVQRIKIELEDSPGLRRWFVDQKRNRYGSNSIMISMQELDKQARELWRCSQKHCPNLHNEIERIDAAARQLRSDADRFLSVLVKREARRVL